MFIALASFTKAGNIIPPVHYDTTRITDIKKATAAKEKEIFSDKEFQYKEDVKETKSWWNAFWDWVFKKLFGEMTIENTERAWKIIKWTFTILFVAGVIILILRAKFRGLLRKGSQNLPGATFTDLPENIESVDIDGLIEEALKNGDYRLAIRWCFLKSLQLLNKNKQITWMPAKTNIDYQYELSDRTMREDFSKLSYVFEYVWYGEMTTNEAFFAKYKSEVEKFNSHIRA